MTLVNGHDSAATTGSDGCKVIRAGTGTREMNSPHNYTRLPLLQVDISIRVIGVIGHEAFIAAIRERVRVTS